MSAAFGAARASGECGASQGGTRAESDRARTVVPGQSFKRAPPSKEVVNGAQAASKKLRCPVVRLDRNAASSLAWPQGDPNSKYRNRKPAHL